MAVACAPVCILFPLYFTLSSGVQEGWKMVQHHFFACFAWVSVLRHQSRREYTLHTTSSRLVLKEMKRRKNTGGNSARESFMFLRICCTNRCACCSFDSHWYYDWSASARFLCLLFATKESALYRHACRGIKFDLICCVCNTIPRKSNISMLQKTSFERFHFHCVSRLLPFPLCLNIN